MALTWVLVADSSSARFFSTDSRDGALEEFETIEHPQGRMHEQDLTSDLPGRAFDSSGQGRHAMGTSVSPKEQSVLGFAEHIAEYLDKAHNHGDFSQLIVAAPPEFLGTLRKKFSANVKRMIVLELDKNLEQQSAAQVRQQLPEHLPVL